ncbi:MAG: hypothetical protein AB4040_03465 [Synechococcus sp.]
MIQLLAVTHILVGVFLALFLAVLISLLVPLFALPGLWLCWIGIGLLGKRPGFQRIGRLTHLWCLPFEVLLGIFSLHTIQVWLSSIGGNLQEVKASSIRQAIARP